MGTTGQSTLRIGQVARGAGVTVDTIRFYERRGVLPLPLRRASGYRSYTDATVQRIRFVRSLQALGFNLDQVVEVLAAVDQGVATCSNQSHHIETVIEGIDEKIAALRSVRRRAARALQACRGGACDAAGGARAAAAAP